MRIGRRDVALTNLEKVYFPEPGLTKGDLVSYYLDLAPCLLNHVQRRPMQMLPARRRGRVFPPEARS
jgi:bifunctional non-homologous end joining protein LigD